MQSPYSKETIAILLFIGHFIFTNKAFAKTKKTKAGNNESAKGTNLSDWIIFVNFSSPHRFPARKIPKGIIAIAAMKNNFE